MQKLSVSSLIRYLKNKLDTDSNLQKVLVSGEISNFHAHFSGHLYFTLKDETSQIKCVMFKSYASTLTFLPKTGDKVIVNANTSLYETSGELQLYITKITLDGIGDLYQKYEELKIKLEKNHIFDDNHKIDLEKEYIDSVAVLVGDKSAAMSDIKTTFLRRWPLCNVDYYPVLVQGSDAPINIIETLKIVDNKNYDCIILARGGGSFEDLFCFNDEDLVMCIYNLKTFIITGIGHEQDYTLCDFVADKRAATPTASVELITPNYYDVLSLINDNKQLIIDNMNNFINEKHINLDYYIQKLNNYDSHLKTISLSIDNNLNLIKNIINNILNKDKLIYKRLNTLLEAYSHQNILKRGYSLVMQNDKVVKLKKNLKDDEFDIYFFDGKIKAKVR